VAFSRNPMTMATFAHWSFRQDLVDLMCCTVSHALAPKNDKLLVLTALTSNTQKAMFNATALRVIPELPNRPSGYGPDRPYLYYLTPPLKLLANRL